MKQFTSTLLGISLLGLAVSGYAAGADKKEPASPAAGQQQEERTGAHSQPYTAGSSATDAEVTDKSDTTRSADKTREPGSAGASASMDKGERFKSLDVDGDDHISKAEAAGNADVVTGFDRADRDKDGKLSRAEFERLGEKPAAKSAAKRTDRNASTGATGEPRPATGGMRSGNNR